MNENNKKTVQMVYIKGVAYIEVASLLKSLEDITHLDLYLFKQGLIDLLVNKDD